MARYRVVLVSSAAKELKKLPSQAGSRIVTQLDELASVTRPTGCKKLRGGGSEWRIRVGDYRVVYTIDDAKVACRSNAHPSPQHSVRMILSD